MGLSVALDKSSKKARIPKEKRKRVPGSHGVKAGKQKLSRLAFFASYR